MLVQPVLCPWWLSTPPNVFRAFDPVADAMLGARMLLARESRACPYDGGNNCGMHLGLALIIIAASALDLVCSVVCIHVNMNKYKNARKMQVLCNHARMPGTA
jgi:hypothetical protein